MEVDDIQPVIKIFPENTFGDPLLEIPVGGRQDADIRGDGGPAADALHLPVFDDPEDLSLGRQGHVAHLVEKDGPALGLFQFSDSFLHPGGDTLFNAEDLALEDRLRDGRAVQGDKGPAAPGAFIVDGSGNEFLTRSRFAGDEDIHRRVGDPINLLQKIQDGGTGAENLRGLKGPLEGMLQTDIFPGQSLFGCRQFLLDLFQVGNNLFQKILPRLQPYGHHPERFCEFSNQGRIQLRFGKFE